MRARPSAILAVLLLALPAFAPVVAASSDDPMEPVRVALAALPGAVRLAIKEAEDHLLTDVSQRHLQDVRDYVAGFRDLPPGDGGLKDPRVRDAYAWTEDVVEVFLAIPGRFTTAETAGAFCRAYTSGDSSAEAQRMVRDGLRALAAMRSLRDEAQRLLDHVPELVNATPVEEGLATLQAWQEGEGAQVEVCLIALAALLAIPAQPSNLFDAVLLPSTIYPSGHLRVVGHSSLGPVTVRAPTLNLDAAPTLAGSSFSLTHTVPRKTPLGPHAIAVRSGGQQIDLTLDVEKARVTLSIQAPTRVALNGTFTVRVQAASVAGPGEVDRATVTMTWESAARGLALKGGNAQTTLRAATLGRQALVVDYPGTDVLLPAHAAVLVDVVPRLPPIPPSPPPSNGLGFGVGFVAGGRQLLDQFGSTILLLVLLILVLLAFLAAAILSQRRAARDAAWRRPTLAKPTTFPSSSIVQGFAFLFDVLRRRGIVPPGRTVREWLPSADAPEGMARQFDEVRYGGRAEGSEERSPTLAWARAAWRRWRR